MKCIRTASPSWRSCTVVAISRPGGANGASGESARARGGVAADVGSDHGGGMATSDAPAAKTACVVVGAAPEEVAAVGRNDRTTLRANRLGTLVTGRPGDLVIDYAAELPGPVYDVMYSA